jgi:uncharacterized protein
MSAMTEELRIIDADSHVVEPADLWTSRLPAKWADRCPRVEWDEAGGEYRWKVGDLFLSGVGEYAAAGWKELFPSHPPTLDEADPACYDAVSRLQHLDEDGIFAQVLYPNIIGFETHAFITQLGPELALECVRTYNDFLAEFASADPRRLIPIMMLPFWDPEASVAEMARAQELGHKGILFGAQLERIGYPNITAECYERVLAEAEARELSMNFHLGFNLRTTESSEREWKARTKNAWAGKIEKLESYRQNPVNSGNVNFVRRIIKYAVRGQVNVIDAAMDVILGGLCRKYPKLRFVSVESGFGHWPYYLEQTDWLCKMSGASVENADWLPSENFRRSFSCTFQYEEESVPLFESWQDNVMFTTDFPHRSSVLQGTESDIPGPTEMLKMRLADQKPEVVEKIFHGNAARLYQVS